MTTRVVLGCVVALGACGDAVGTSIVESALDVTNGSFEANDYSGWTLLGSSAEPTASTFGLAADGLTINAGESAFDHDDKVAVAQNSPGLPVTYNATDGNLVAFLLQNAPETQRMYQRVTLPTCGSFVRWDMAYESHAAFSVASQFIAINIRDEADTILATPFKTMGGNPLVVAAMTEFEVDLSAFDGQMVGLDFEVSAPSPLDVALDRIRIECDNPPIVTPSIPSHDFGGIMVGSTSAAQSIDLRNTGASDLTISAISALPPFTVTGPTLPITLPIGDSTTIMATFSPNSEGQALGEITIESDDQNSPTTISLAGEGLPPIVGIGVSQLDFGGQRVGTTSGSQIVSVTNNGGVDVTISSVTAAAPFAVVQPTNITIAPFDSAQFEVTFAPTAPGAALGDLVVTSDAAGSPTSIPLTGFGILGSLEVSPAALVFGDVRVALQSTSQPLTVQNTGDGPITITGITGPGIAVDGAAFPVSLLPGAELTFEVTFTPSTAGPITGTLSIMTSTGNTQVPVSGTAVAEGLVADPAVIDLGSILAGEATNSFTVTLTNITSAPLAIETIDVGDDQFVIDPAPPTTPILPGASIEFGVRFVPDGEGDAASTLTVVLQGASDSDVTIAVSGDGFVESGCCSANGQSSSVWLALATLVALRRRRRPRAPVR